MWRHPGGAHELYNLTEDPDEMTNLIEHRDCPDIVDSMRRDMEVWYSRYVYPQIDGTKLPVTGCGQLASATAKDAFSYRHLPQWYPERL